MALRFLPIPFVDMLIFGGLVAAGFYWRRRPEIHKRLMLLPTITVLDAAFTRFPFAFVARTGPLALFGLADVVLILCVVYGVVSGGCIRCMCGVD